jgi:hypothetical protein
VVTRTAFVELDTTSMNDRWKVPTSDFKNRATLLARFFASETLLA